MQVVRVFALPPAVNEPVAQVSHPSALPAAEYLLSEPQLVQLGAVWADHVPAAQSVQTDWRATADLPAWHGVCFAPSQWWPAGQILHSWLSRKWPTVHSVGPLSCLLTGSTAASVQSSWEFVILNILFCPVTS